MTPPAGNDRAAIVPLPFPPLDGLPGYPCAWSPCKRYRYTLWRNWSPGLRIAMFIGLNPSTADEAQDDPTIRRCIGFAKSWDCDSIVMTNLFAFRATDPRDMKAADDPVGPDNNHWLETLSDYAELVVAAWGAHGAYLDRAAGIAARLPNLRCLGVTASGAPRHPLYLPANAELRPWP